MHVHVKQIRAGLVLWLVANLLRLVLGVRLNTLDVSQGIHATNHPAKDGVLAIQVCATPVCDEKLTHTTTSAVHAGMRAKQG